MVPDEMQNLPPWLVSALQNGVKHFGTMSDWTRTSGLGRSLSIELVRADVIPSVLIGNRPWIDIWGGLALLHEAAFTRQPIAVPGEARARELARKAELRAKAQQVRGGQGARRAR